MKTSLELDGGGEGGRGMGIPTRKWGNSRPAKVKGEALPLLTGIQAVLVLVGVVFLL